MGTLSHIQTPRRLSFSSFWAARQKASIAYTDGHSAEVPEHLVGEEERIRTLGMFFHRLVENVAKGLLDGGEFLAVVRSSFRGVLAEYQREFPDIDFANEPKITEIYDTVRHYWGEVTGPGGRKRHEREIQSRDGLLFGVPDLVTETEVGIYLRDFKLVSDPSKLITEKNEAQMAFYSYLIEEAYGAFPFEVKLVGLRGASVELSIDCTYARSIADEAKTILRQLRSGAQNSSIDVDAATNESI